jgi:hypothetical protein
MSREVHVRICEGLGVKFPWATRPSASFFNAFLLLLLVVIFKSHPQCNILRNSGWNEVTDRNDKAWSIILMAYAIDNLCS